MSFSRRILTALLVGVLTHSAGFAQVDTSKPPVPDSAMTRLPRASAAMQSLVKPEVVLTRSMKADELSELTKDLQTLNHLVRKAIGQSSPRRSALGVSVQDGKGMSIRYTQGAGVVLTYSINAVLWVANEKKQTAAKPEPKKPESEWDMASRQLHSPARVTPKMRMGGGYYSFAVSAAAFNAAYVSDLEEKIRKALKNVVRVRHLQTDSRAEPVVVVLKGLNGSSMMTFSTDASRWDGDAKDAVSVYRYGSTYGGWTSAYQYFVDTPQGRSEFSFDLLDPNAVQPKGPGVGGK